MQLLAGRRVYVSAVSILLGVTTVQGMAELPPSWVSLIVFAIAIPGFVIRSFQPLSWLLLGFAWAALRADLILVQELPSALEGKDLVVEGIVTSLVQRSGPHLKFSLSTLGVSGSGKHTFPQSKVMLRWYHVDEDVRPGQGWRLTVRLKRPHGFQNPGGFDYEKWLFRHRIRATGYIRDAVRLPELDQVSWWSGFRERLQRHLRHSELASEGLIRALVIGDRSGVEDDQWRALVRTGTLHLLAISGLHIGLVSGFCFVLGSILARILGTGLLWFPAPLAGAVSAMLGGGLYALLAGLTIPTQRAFVMVAAVMAAVLLRRSVDIFRCLALALVLILVVDPLSVLDTGLWLSFGAVAAILLATKLTKGMGSWITRLILVQLLLSVFLAPLVLMFFGQVSLIAPIANLIAIPVVAFSVVPLVLIAATALGFGWEWIGDSLFGLADQILGVLLPVLRVLSEPGWAVWISQEYGLLLVLIAVGFVLAIARRNRVYLVVGLLCLFVMAGLDQYLSNDPIEPGDFELTVLDVGQGLSIVVRTRSHILLYDTGARFGPRFDAGTAVIVPYLRHRGIDDLDMLIISHGDNDHIGGMQAVLRGLNVGRRLTSVPDKVPGSAPCVAGDGWVWDDVRFAFLSPAEENPPEHNNGSCVVKVTGQFGSVLITGDIEREVEGHLLDERPGELPSDVLLVPHQGSKTSSTEAFVEQVAPRVAIVAAGYRNQYGHPAEPVVERYRERNIPLFNTARDGAVSVRVAAGAISTDVFRISRRRYWFDNGGRRTPE